MTWRLEEELRLWLDPVLQYGCELAVFLYSTNKIETFLLSKKKQDG